MRLNVRVDLPTGGNELYTVETDHRGRSLDSARDPLRAFTTAPNASLSRTRGSVNFKRAEIRLSGYRARSILLGAIYDN